MFLQIISFIPTVTFITWVVYTCVYIRFYYTERFPEQDFANVVMTFVYSQHAIYKKALLLRDRLTELMTKIEKKLDTTPVKPVRNRIRFIRRIQ